MNSEGVTAAAPTRTAEWGEPRSRTVTWHDPLITAAGAMQRSGLETMEAIRDGLLPPPPIALLVQMGIGALEEGRVEFTCDVDESVYNPIGVVHGGLVCTLLDTVAGCAVHTTLPAGFGYTSIELKVNYLRAVHATSGPLTAVGTVVKPGRRVAFAEGEVRDASGRTVATATSSLLVFPLPPA
ncbi:PaaI family thioesterase [Blastococcus jejuensis]|uniref:PaaI family thioesterase n=1 Tax=Blastococcus jejuensis TaxID=351224 RepID=A0ABP6PAX5_9ACTN